MEQIVKKHADKLKFLIVGGLNTAIDFSVLFILVKAFNFPILYANVISTSIALVFSFFVNKNFTFKDNGQNNISKMIKFLIITLIGLWLIQPVIISGIRFIIEPWMVNSDFILFIGKAIATIVTLIWNYLLYKKFVFIKNRDKHLCDEQF